MVPCRICRSYHFMQFFLFAAIIGILQNNADAQDLPEGIFLVADEMIDPILILSTEAPTTVPTQAPTPNLRGSSVVADQMLEADNLSESVGLPDGIFEFDGENPILIDFDNYTESIGLIDGLSEFDGENPILIDIDNYTESVGLPDGVFEFDGENPILIDIDSPVGEDLTDTDTDTGVGVDVDVDASFPDDIFSEVDNEDPIIDSTTDLEELSEETIVVVVSQPTEPVEEEQEEDASFLDKLKGSFGMIRDMIDRGRDPTSPSF